MWRRDSGDLSSSVARKDYDLALNSFEKAQKSGRSGLCLMKRSRIGAAGAAEEGRKVTELVEQLQEQLRGERRARKLKDLSSHFPTSGHVGGCGHGLPLRLTRLAYWPTWPRIHYIPSLQVGFELQTQLRHR